MKRILCFLFIVIVAQATAVMAHPRGINDREHRQQQRIRQGLRDRELTRGEAARLEGQQARIRAYERYARRDGDLTRQERRRLDNLLDHSSRDIFRQTHDRQDRNP